VPVLPSFHMKPASVRISGDDIKELGQVKAEFERILNWEVVKVDSRIAWDPFFGGVGSRHGKLSSRRSGSCNLRKTEVSR
jgi:hypothetical protein